MPSSKRLFVGSIPYTTTEGELLRLFVQEGKVIDVQLMLDSFRRSKGMGFVEYERYEDAQRAQARFHNYKLQDRKIIVDFAKEDPLKTQEGQQNFYEAQARRGNRFEKFDKKLNTRQERNKRKDEKRNKNRGFFGKNFDKSKVKY